jgi:origin recognition complex subunit 4
MDDSPRSSKRRKLDTPKRIESSSLAKGSATRASGRLANRSTKSYADLRAEKEEATPVRTVRSAQKAKNGTAAKRNVQPDIDVYDDIEGALSVEPSKRPAQRRAGVRTQEETHNTADELQEVDTTLKPSRGRPKKAQTVGRSAPKTLVNGHTHGSEVDEESETHDELAAEAASPSKRARSAKTLTASARKAPAPRKTPAKLPSAKKTAVSVRKKAPLETYNEPTLASPSKPSRRRKPLEERTAIPDTEDESARLAPPSSKRKIASARRRANRTDNINNGDEDEILHDGASQDDDDAMDVDGNSILESVLDPTEPSPFNQPTSAQKLAQKAAQKEKATLPLIYGNLPEGHELDLLKTIVLERIANKRACPLVGLDAEYKTVHQLVEQTVTAGEGNSMLLIGARGSGKTALVGKVLSEVAKDNGGDYHVVRLNGFIHTDDKIALREIWRQLGKEMEIEEDGSGPGKNYADTLATLLALLSHPSEQTGEITDQVAKTVIFIIDEFDLFAQHPRQTLLYNLFDIAQSRKAPIAVLGLTTRIDVTNHLEKRVKSRFSHRYVHLSLAKTFTAFQEMCKAGLIVETEHLSVKERGILEGGTKDTKQNVLAEWNVNVNVSSSHTLHTHLTNSM